MYTLAIMDALAGTYLALKKCLVAADTTCDPLRGFAKQTHSSQLLSGTDLHFDCWQANRSQKSCKINKLNNTDRIQQKKRDR